MSGRTDLDDDILLAELLRPLVAHGKKIIATVLLVALGAALLTGAYYRNQPTEWTALLRFRTTFDEATVAKYPSGIPFAMTDILRTSIVDAAIARSGLSNQCEADAIRSGLSIRNVTAPVPAGPAVHLMFPEFQLDFVRPVECSNVAPEPVFAMLSGILEEWATDAVERRGAATRRLALVAPELLEPSALLGESPFLRAERLRELLVRLLDDTLAIELLPGAKSLAVSDPRNSLPEVKRRIDDLLRVRLDVLIASVAPLGAEQSKPWLGLALEVSMTRYRAALERAETYRTALRDYGARPAEPTGPSEVGSVDQSRSEKAEAAERAVRISESVEHFKQELTRQYVAASSEAAFHKESIERYRHLLNPGAGSVRPQPVASFTTTFEAIANDAKREAQALHALYDRLSQGSYHSGATLYRVVQGPEAATRKPFTRRSGVFLVVGVAFGSACLLALGVVLFANRRLLLKAQK